MQPAMEPGKVYDVNRDKRIGDADRFLDEKRREAMQMCALWSRSRKSYAADELRYWRAVLRSVDAQTAALGDGAQD